jgi:hypothetical protein
MMYKKYRFQWCTKSIVFNDVNRGQANFVHHRGQANFSACPVWMYTQSNTTNIIENGRSFSKIISFVLASRVQSVLDLSTKFREQAYELK